MTDAAYRIEANLGSYYEQIFDESLSDFDIVTPAWDGEANEVADFDSTIDADGDMNDAAGEGHDGGNAIEFTFDDANAAYGTLLADAVDQKSGVVTLYIHTNDVAIQSGKYIRIIEANNGTGQPQFYTILYNNAGTHELKSYYRPDVGAPPNFVTATLTAGWHKIVYMFSVSTGAGNNDGYCYFFIDDILEGAATGIDNDTRDWDYVRFGMMYTGSTTFGGSFLLDTIKIDPVGGPMLDTLAAQNGTYGVSIPIMNTTARCVSFTDPDGETTITAEASFDPNTIVLPDTKAFYIIAGDALDFLIDFRYTVAEGYQIRGRAQEDGGGVLSTSFYTITDEPHTIRAVWGASEEDGADNGYLRLYADNVLVGTLTGLDNDTKEIDAIHFGAVSFLDAMWSLARYYQ